jgi:cytochrome c5|tara:strand:- start:722 stop:1204 length:483 start_codon:yes stop_codon:yes gene_type:complete
VSEDKKIFNSIGLVIAVLAGIAILISIVATSLIDDSSTSTAWQEKKVLDRIKPLGVVATTAEEAKKATPKLEAAPVVASGPMSAEQVYNTACLACHSTGVAGAPKTGDLAAWAPRIAQGEDVLFEHATKGFKGMPPRGGSSQLSDDEVKAAIGFMLAKSQ